MRKKLVSLLTAAIMGGCELVGWAQAPVEGPIAKAVGLNRIGSLQSTVNDTAPVPGDDRNIEPINAVPCFAMPFCSAGTPSPKAGVCGGIPCSVQCSLAGVMSFLPALAEATPAEKCAAPLCPIDCGNDRPGGYLYAEVGAYFVVPFGTGGQNIGNSVLSGPSVSIGYTNDNGAGVRGSGFSVSGNQQTDFNLLKSR